MWSNFLSFFLSFYPLTVQWEKPVVFSSKLSYFVGQPKKRWSDVDFNEDWKTASEGTWGSYDSSSTAAFRAGFKVSNDQGYTYALLLLRGEGTASIFVNGASFGKATLEPAACRVVIPFSFLTSGDNVIAVSLAKGASSTISFALSVELNTTPQLRLTEGVASAIQAKPSPSHPAGDAFLDDDVFSHYWLATTFPSELVFTFNNTQQVVNRVHMMNSVTRQPFSMQVVGVNGDERVLLASFNRDSIAQGASGTEAVFLTFNNLRAFSSIHLVFDSTAEDCAVQMTAFASTDARCTRVPRSGAILACTRTRRCTHAVHWATRADEGARASARAAVFTGRRAGSSASRRTRTRRRRSWTGRSRSRA